MSKQKNNDEGYTYWQIAEKIGGLSDQAIRNYVERIGNYFPKKVGKSGRFVVFDKEQTNQFLKVYAIFMQDRPRFCADEFKIFVDNNIRNYFSNGVKPKKVIEKTLENKFLTRPLISQWRPYL